MTSLTVERLPVATAGPTRAAVFAGVLSSEWTKLRTVRSTYWTLLAAVAGMIGLSALVCAIFVNKYPTMSAGDRAQFDPTSVSLVGVNLAALAIGVLGVLVIASEYSTGAIRTTLAAVPQRGTVLAAKAVVFGVVVLVVGLVSSLGAYFLGQAILSSGGLESHLGDPGVLRVVLGAALYLTVLGLLALGIGTLIRHSAGAISALFGVILVLPGLVLLLPSSWNHAIAKFLPSNAGAAIAQSDAVRAGTAPGHGPELAPWVGLGLFALYAVAVLAVATVVLDRRDA
jgi:ABC-type transport system involved in multi-copper enzyme maturation permease subunit